MKHDAIHTIIGLAFVTAALAAMFLPEVSNFWEFGKVFLVAGLGYSCLYWAWVILAVLLRILTWLWSLLPQRRKRTPAPKPRGLSIVRQAGGTPTPVSSAIPRELSEFRDRSGD